MSRYKPYPKYKESGTEWLGEVPEHWVVKPFWTLYTRVKRTNYASEELLSVYRDYGVIPKDSRDDNDNKASEDLSTYQLVEVNDIAMNKMKAWQGSLGVSIYRGIVSPAYFVFKPMHKENGKYMHHLFRSPQYIAGYLSLSKGIRINQWDLDPQYHSRMPVSLPPFQEQQSIANFLDNATCKIDTLIQKQQNLIELLKEKRQALISHAVTKGLNPHVKMKDSGVEWLGEVPEHWEKGLLSNLFTNNKEKNSGMLNNNLLSLSYGKIVNKDIETSFGLLPESFESYQIVHDGYIVLRLTDLQNDQKSLRTGFVTQTGIITSAYVALKKKSKSIGNERYFHLYLHSFDIFKGFYGMGSGVRQSLNYDELKKLQFVLPPLNEQNEIVNYLDNATCKIDTLISKAQKAIELLKERRTALISATVTGKIDVRECAGDNSNCSEIPNSSNQR